MYRSKFSPQRQELSYGQDVALGPDPVRFLKQGIWLYFILLVMEGALRKWFLPDLASPLLVIRDPLALWLVFKSWQRGMLPPSPYLIGVVLAGIISIYTAALLGHGNLIVALFGARILLIHFPLVFVIGRIFDEDDVIRVGKVAMWMAAPMAILIALQFYGSQTAWVNRGVGGEIGEGFTGALGFFRPSGTFSFTNGVTFFFSFVACFVIYFWFKPQGISWFLLCIATLSVIVSIPLSISRGLFFQVILSLLFAFVAIARTPYYLGKILLAGVVGVIALAFLSQTGFFQKAFEVFVMRLESANRIEGGVEGVFIDRFLGGLIGAITNLGEQPLWGYGSGAGSNVGSMLLTGERKFLVAEGEWARLIGELGVVIGIGVIFLRVSLGLKIAYASFQELLIHNNLLPWMLLSFGLITVVQSQWAQPTALGFSTLTGGMMIASLRPSSSMDNTMIPETEELETKG